MLWLVDVYLFTKYQLYITESWCINDYTGNIISSKTTENNAFHDIFSPRVMKKINKGKKIKDK